MFWVRNLRGSDKFEVFSLTFWTPLTLSRLICNFTSETASTNRLFLWYRLMVTDRNRVLLRPRQVNNRSVKRLDRMNRIKFPLLWLRSYPIFIKLSKKLHLWNGFIVSFLICSPQKLLNHLVRHYLQILIRLRWNRYTTILDFNSSSERMARDNLRLTIPIEFERWPIPISREIFQSIGLPLHVLCWH